MVDGQNLKPRTHIAIMSGHSKWSTIKHQKGATDKKRSQNFSRSVKLITIAAKEGGADPESNFKLRLAMDKAKAINMPKDNIERAISRATGGDAGGEELYQLFYEGFGPFQTAIIVECVTDNKNRSLSQVKSFFEKRGYSLGSTGSVSYLFDQNGEISVEKGENPDELELKLMDFNPDDIEERGDSFILYSRVGDLAKMHRQLKESGLRVLESGLLYKPKSKIKIPDDKKEDFLDFLDKLSDLEDVEEIYTNADL